MMAKICGGNMVNTKLYVTTGNDISTWNTTASNLLDIKYIIGIKVFNNFSFLTGLH